MKLSEISGDGVTRTPLASIQIDEGQVKTFFTREQLDEWWVNERNAWRWVQAVSAEHSALDGLQMGFDKAIEQLSRLLDGERKDSATTEKCQRYLDQYKDLWICSESDCGQYILGVKAARGASEALGALAMSVYWKLHKETEHKFKTRAPGIPYYWAPDVFRGAMNAVLRQTPVSEDNIQRQRHQLLAGEFQKIIEEHKGFANVERTTWTDFRKSCDDSEAKRLEDSDRQLETWQTNLENLEKSYREHMNLKAPVEYWAEKANVHRKGKATWLNRSIGAGTVGFVVFVIIIVGMFYFGRDTLHSTAFLTKTVIVSVGVLAFATWPVRICLRMFLSEAHLETDAEEREAIAKTYISMVKEGHIPAETATRDVVLKALFRHSATGIVKDDSSPPGGAELVANIVTPKV